MHETRSTPRERCRGPRHASIATHAPPPCPAAAPPDGPRRGAGAAGWAWRPRRRRRRPGCSPTAGRAGWRGPGTPSRSAEAVSAAGRSRHGRAVLLVQESGLATRCVEYVSAIRDVSSHRPPTGRPAAFPDGYGLGTRTDGPDWLRRPSHPPDFQGGPNAHERGSGHVRHHPLMGTAEIDRCGSAQSLICGCQRKTQTVPPFLTVGEV
jgi:hypothetical protein